MAIVPPDSNWFINSTSLNSVVQAARVLGAPVGQLLEEAGIEAAQLKEAGARHPVATLYKFYEKAACHTTPDLGIYAGRIDYISRLNLQLYTCGVCETFREYLNLMPSAMQFAGDIGEMLVAREGSEIRLDWIPLWTPNPAWRFQSDEMLTASAAIVNSLCVQPIPVRRAHFTYPEPENCDLLCQTFGSDLHFDQSVSCLYFDRACLDFPVIKLQTEWSRAVSQTTLHLFEADPVIADIRRVLQRLLPAGDVGIDRVAAELGIARRTLQRRLADRNTQFVVVLQDLRHELALQYLVDQGLNITDIAFLLGYSDQGSFSTAFKARYGQSPREFRRQ